jgi:hypothetical protein
MTNPASSELGRAAALLAELREAGLLLTSSRPLPPRSSPAAAPEATVPPPQVESASRAPAVAPARPAAPSAAVAPPPPPAPAPQRQPVYRAERVRQLLADMCKRGGFSGAVLADRSGLALAEFNSPLDVDSLAAFASVVGGTLEQAEKLLGKRDANNLALDINYVEKIVVRRFTLAQQPAFLLLICPQSIDERSEVELSIDLIAAVLAEEN